MKQQLKTLLNSICNTTEPLIISDEDKDAYYSKLTPFFEEIDLFSPTNPNLTVQCPEPPNNCLVTAHSIDGVFYAHCECYDDIGLIEINPSQLNHSKLNPDQLCLWLAKQLKTDRHIKQEEPLLWHIGKFDARGTSTQVYVFFSDSHDATLTISDKIKNHYSSHIIIWFGTTPITGITTRRLVSFWEIISIGSTLELDIKGVLDRLSPSKTINSNFTLLDTHIALEKEDKQWYIHFERTGNKFKYQYKIKPQAGRLIQHCFQIRNYSENAKTLEAFSAAGLAANKRTISSKIKEVNDLCKKRSQKPVFHKFEKNKWGFNPNLIP